MPFVCCEVIQTRSSASHKLRERKLKAVLAVNQWSLSIPLSFLHSFQQYEQVCKENHVLERSREDFVKKRHL